MNNGDDYGVMELRIPQTVYEHHRELVRRFFRTYVTFVFQSEFSYLAREFRVTAEISGLRPLPPHWHSYVGEVFVDLTRRVPTLRVPVSDHEGASPDGFLEVT